MGRKQGTYNYDDDFRAQAVALVMDEKLPVSVAATRLGIAFETLRKWIKESGRKQEDEVSKSDKQRFKELERENRALKQERDILKETVGIFSQHPK